jgi:hypothetical protein
MHKEGICNAILFWSLPTKDTEARQSVCKEKHATTAHTFSVAVALKKHFYK